jgi:hypothetical protein
MNGELAFSRAKMPGVVRMRKTDPEVLKTARSRRARDVFKTEGTVFLIRTDGVGK